MRSLLPVLFINGDVYGYEFPRLLSLPWKDLLSIPCSFFPQLDTLLWGECLEPLPPLWPDQLLPTFFLPLIPERWIIHKVQDASVSLASGVLKFRGRFRGKKKGGCYEGKLTQKD
jgi:hypothetical protein